MLLQNKSQEVKSVNTNYCSENTTQKEFGYMLFLAIRTQFARNMYTNIMCIYMHI